jgi:hypothetical protein
VHEQVLRVDGVTAGAYYLTMITEEGSTGRILRIIR